MPPFMRFEAREIKPYAEPVPAAELREGEVYYSVRFLDDRMLIPEMEAVVYIGRDLVPGDVGQVYFQDAASYRRGVRFESSTGETDALFDVCAEVGMLHVYEYERALDVLLGCSLRRQKVRGG